MDNTGEALFAAICEQPGDIALRLVFADWLLENGQGQWAAFVRLQCQAPDFSLGHFQARYVLFDLFEEVGEFDPFESDWLKKLPKPPGVHWQGAGFRRGFIHSVGFASAQAFRDHSSAVFAATPIDMLAVERLSDKSIADVLASSLLSRLEWLALYGRFGDEGMRLLADCPGLSNLKHLSIDSNVGDDGAEVLAAGRHCGNLRSLYLDNHRIGDRGALALARSTNLCRVNFLSFRVTSRLSRPVVNELKERFENLDGWPTRG